jgi:hypothetical protein
MDAHDIDVDGCCIHRDMWLEPCTNPDCDNQICGECGLWIVPKENVRYGSNGKPMLDGPYCNEVCAGTENDK